MTAPENHGRGMRLVYVEEGGFDFKQVFFDVTLKEAPSHSSTVTRHPVVRGIQTTDHVQIEPDVLTFEVFVTNTPTRSVDVDGAVGAYESESVKIATRSLSAGAQASNTGQVKNAIWKTNESNFQKKVLTFPRPFNRVQAVYEQLEKLRRSATLLTVETSYRVWDSMILTKIEAPRDGTTGSAVSFVITLEQIRQTEIEIVAAPAPQEVRAHTEVARGSHTAEEAPPITRSAALAVLRGLF